MPGSLIIGVDVRDLRLAKTGTRTYLEELCREFKKMQSEEVRFYFFDTSIQVYTGQNKLLRYLEHARYQFWKQLILPLKAFFRNCDIVFCTDNCVPIMHLGYQTVPVFHDAFCFESPEAYGRLWLWLYMKTAVPAARRSRFVITPTEWSKKQIHHYTQIPNEKLLVVYEGAKYLNAGEASNSNTLLDRFSLTHRSYILHVGSMFKRKNIPALIEAFAIVKQTNPTLKLVLAGPTPANEFDSDYMLIKNTIKKNNLNDEVILTGYLSDPDLALIYQNALLYVFPSINEGFGIPVLEAFKNDLPVLVANNTCLPEVGGDAVLQFDPFKVTDVAEKIILAANDIALRNSMIHKGRQRLKLFSWENTAKQLIEVFRKAV